MTNSDSTATKPFAPVPDHDPAGTRTFGSDGGEYPVPALTTPPAVPGYEIERELGRGGMGVVYKARDTRLDRPVALKIVLGGGHASAAALARFLAEAKAAAAVRHPGIAQVYELGEHDGLPFLAMEYCAGGTLADRLAGVPLPPRDAAELVEQIASAVHAAHQAGVVHRDLKPANILLTEDRGQRTEDREKRADTGSSLSSVLCPLSSLNPKVTDFGLARRGDSASGLTAPGAVFGSPSYMAPEQADGKKEIGPAADVYGLGAILYECLTGRPPFRAATPLETVMQVLKDDPVAPSRLVPKLPRDLETVCLKCIQKDPRRRYGSAAELADDLRRFLDGRTIAARPAGAVERTWKAAKRRPGAAAAIGATILAVAAVVGVVVWSNRELQQERNAARAAEIDADGQRVKAEHERALADTARERAEVRLVVTLDAIERMMVRMAGEKWARNPALQAERRAVLEEAIALYRGFSAEDSKDPRVQRQTALTEVRIATAYSALADYQRAGEALTAAEKTQKHLTGTYPQDPEYANDLALTLLQTGHVHVLSARFDAAIGYYSRASEQARRAIALAPAREEFKLTLAETLTAQGHYNTSRGYDEALKYHTEVVAVARELAAKPDPGYGARLFLAVGLMNVGVVEISRNRALGTEMLAEAAKALDALAGQPAPSARWADVFDNTRGQMFVFQANFLLRNDPAAALKKIDDGLAIFDSLLAVQPKSFPHQIQKLNALTAKVDLLEQLKRSKEARKVIAQVVELGESIATSSPSMAWVRQRFVIFQSLELVYSVRDGETKDLDRRVEDLLKTLPRKREPNPLWNSLGDTVRYNVACAYSQATLFEPSDERERAAAKAIDVLADLDRAGHFTLPGKVVLVETDSDLDPLRDRADFKLLLARVKEKGPRPVAPPPRPVTSHRALP